MGSGPAGTWDVGPSFWEGGDWSLVPAGAGLLLRSPAIQEESGSHTQCDWVSPGPNTQVPNTGPLTSPCCGHPKAYGTTTPLFSSLGVALAMSMGMWGVTL